MKKRASSQKTTPFITIGIILLIVAVELSCWLYLARTERGPLLFASRSRYEKQIGLYQPGQDVVLDGPGHLFYRVTINSEGLRGPNLSPRARVNRLLGIGDSITFGTYTAEEDHFLTLLAKVLSADGPQYVPVNGGVEFFGVREEWEWLDEKIDRLNPSLAVLTFHSDDLYQLAHPVLKLKDAVRPNWSLSTLLHYSHTVRVAAAQLQTYRYRRETRKLGNLEYRTAPLDEPTREQYARMFMERYDRIDGLVVPTMRSGEIVEWWEKYFDYVRKIRDRLAAVDCPLIINVYPAFPNLLAGLQPNDPHTVLAQFAAAENIILCDPVDEFRKVLAQQNAAPFTYAPIDFRPNATGHRIMAGQLERCIRLRLPDRFTAPEPLPEETVPAAATDADQKNK